MDVEVSPKSIDEFIGHKNSVLSLKNWAKCIKKDIYYSKRICFLTGSVGSGKSVLAKLILKEGGFDSKEFISSNLRIKQERELLYQTFCYKNVIALLNKKQEYRKAIIIDDFENMSLASQEIFKNIKEFIKTKKSVGIPIIFIGNKFFKGKKPLQRESIFIRLFPRSLGDTQIILKQIINTFKNKYLENIIFKEYEKNNTKQMDLCKKVGSDVRKIIKYFEFISSSKKEENSISIIKTEKRGPLNSLYQILSYNHSIDQIIDQVSIESNIPYGIHTSYIEYIIWFFTYKKYTCKNIRILYSLLEMSLHFSIFGRLLDYERKNQLWGFSDIANTIVCWGFKIIINQEKSFEKDFHKISLPDKEHWWNKLEKGKLGGDEPFDIPIYNKNLRGYLYQSKLLHTSFKMIENNNVKNPSLLRPKNIQNTLQLINLKKMINN